MPEVSHRKGEEYQDAAKHLLDESRLLGFDVALFGDAYDITRKACTLGNIVFDFSLVLRRSEKVKHILYAECKRKDGTRVQVDSLFREFLMRVYQAIRTALSAQKDDAEAALFVFISNIPPQDWQQFSRNRLGYYKKLDWSGQPPEEAILAEVVKRIHLLVLTWPLIQRE